MSDPEHFTIILPYNFCLHIPKDVQNSPFYLLTALHVGKSFLQATLRASTSSCAWQSILHLKITLSAPRDVPSSGCTIPLLQHSSHSSSDQALVSLSCCLMNQDAVLQVRFAPKDPPGPQTKFLTFASDSSWMRRHEVGHGQQGTFSLIPHPVHLIPVRNPPALNCSWRSE